MGAFKILSGGRKNVDYDVPVPDNNPDPFYFNIIEEIEIGKLWVSHINYPNCTNYEGNKILVTKYKPSSRKEIDPHFIENGGVVARFKPTKKGWEHAIMFAKCLE